MLKPSLSLQYSAKVVTTTKTSTPKVGSMACFALVVALSVTMGYLSWTKIVSMSIILPEEAFSVQQKEQLAEPFNKPYYSSSICMQTMVNNSTIDRIIKIHNATAPSQAAGQWVYQEERKQFKKNMTQYEAYRQCLLNYKNSNCKPSPSAKGFTAKAIREGRLQRSPEILEGIDPYVWFSEDPAYSILDPFLNPPGLIPQLLQDRQIFLIGDSLTRQWWESLHCELEHMYNVSGMAHYLKNFNGNFPQSTVDRFLKSNNATSRDYLVFNIGHHTDGSNHGIGDQWRKHYILGLKQYMSKSYSPIPDNHIFFRTTSARHFWNKGYGDWDSGNWRAGGTAPKMEAEWLEYGGKHPVQPEQNMIGIKMIQNQARFGILDVSPLMLSRADATSDGSHFCLPGPTEAWSQMLYYRILHQNEDNITTGSHSMPKQKC
jgi:hypothetical protein